MKKSHLLLLVSPYVILLLGIAFNQAALYANGRLMPVLFPAHADIVQALSDDVNHTLMTHATHLKILCDWIISNKGVSSIGDIMQDFSNNIRIPSLVAFVALTVKDFVKR